MKKRIELVYVGDSVRSGRIYHDFDIRRLKDGETVGEISIKEASDDFVMIHGNVGYRISEAFRGHKYAAEALRQLRAKAREYCVSKLVICCLPENLASQRTAILGGAKLDRIVELKPSHDLYAYGKRRVLRYFIELGNEGVKT